MFATALHHGTSRPMIRGAGYVTDTHAVITTGLVFLTAVSGAFVAGLDAGLVYNEFPLMGGRLAPPLDELLSPTYADAADGSKGTWRNLFENPTTVQFDHCVLTMTTYLATALLFVSGRRAAVRVALPPLTVRATAAVFAMANVQAALGISIERCSTSCWYHSPQRTKPAVSHCSLLCFMSSWHCAGQVRLRERGGRQI
ncbi:cytochrome oxidase assembly protein-domain-containing protein [Lactarius indigo]|nr:cytochrome oxidase assembly protein-domain-containing protein [Lactarius indigo]